MPFAIQALDEIHHGAYSRWVKAGVAAAAGGYVLVTLLDVVIRGFSPITVFTQGATVGLCLLALWLAFHDRLEIAATLTIGAIWLELHSGLLSTGMALSSIVPMPTVIVGAGLLWGGRGAYALAGATAISFPGLALIGHQVLGNSPSDLGDEVYLAVVLIVVMFVTAGLIDLSMRALGSVVVAALASERRVAELVRHAPDGIMALDKDLSIISANPAAERLLGSSEKDLIGTSAVAALSARLSLQAISDLSPLRLQSGEPIVLEFSAGEHVVTVDATTTTFQRSDGSERIQLTLHDATGRVRAQEQERAVQARLEETNRLDSVGRLAGGVAHDFNNHLTVIGGSAEMLLSEPVADTEDLALSILEAKTRAAELTKGLLAFARRQMISPRELAIHEVVADCEPLLKSLVGDKEVRLEIFADPTPLVMADRSQIEQCLVNLLANAKDALGNGGVARVYTAGPGAVSQCECGKSQIVPEGFAEIRVEDDGRGMSDDTMRQAFEPFFTTSPFGERTGLGLSMVHGVVSQNGGVVMMESLEGVGTCVRIRWPVRDGS